jgi:hypothetical protein
MGFALGFGTASWSGIRTEWDHTLQSGAWIRTEDVLRNRFQAGLVLTYGAMSTRPQPPRWVC